jgi:hypothetical protein
MCRAIKQTVRGFPRPLLDISAANFGKIIEQALNATLDPPFNPYENSVNFLIASYIILYVGLTGYVGANPRLLTPQARKVCERASHEHSTRHLVAIARHGMCMHASCVQVMFCTCSAHGSCWRGCWRWSRRRTR